MGGPIDGDGVSLADLDLTDKRMDKPRIFIGSSGKQAKLLQALTRGLQDVAHVDPWTTSLTPGTTTLDRARRAGPSSGLRRLRVRPGRLDDRPAGRFPVLRRRQASPRDNVVFEAGLVRRGARHAPHLHPPCPRRQARPISSASSASAMATRRRPAEMKLLNQSSGRRSRARDASCASTASGGSSP